MKRAMILLFLFMFMLSMNTTIYAEDAQLPENPAPFGVTSMGSNTEELSGRSFTLIMDNGYDWTLEFVDEKNLIYTTTGSGSGKYAYTATKGNDPYTYFVAFTLEGTQYKTDLSIVLDLEQNLTTCVSRTTDENPKYPGMPMFTNIMGAIQAEDGTIPTIRHGYTDELVGKAIRWDYGPMKITHCYLTEHYYIAPMTLEDKINWVKMSGQEPDLEALQKEVEDADYSGEAATYIKIKENMYLVYFAEINLWKANGCDTPTVTTFMYIVDLNNPDDVYRFGTMGDIVKGEIVEEPEIFELAEKNEKSQFYIR